MNVHTIDTAMVRRMVEASAIRGASIIGRPGGWSVMIKMGLSEKPLGTQRTDKPRTWRSLDTCIEYLRNELKILRIDSLDASNYDSAVATRQTRKDASERMKHAHEAAAYDKWFRAQVQASIDDPRPSIPHEQVTAEFAERREALRKKIAAQ
jgi:hypothetical protein